MVIYSQIGVFKHHIAQNVRQNYAQQIFLKILKRIRDMPLLRGSKPKKTLIGIGEMIDD